jgi:hypothetical protein
VRQEVSLEKAVAELEMLGRATGRRDSMQRAIDIVLGREAPRAVPIDQIERVYDCLARLQEVTSPL